MLGEWKLSTTEIYVYIPIPIRSLFKFSKPYFSSVSTYIYPKYNQNISENSQ